MSDKQINDMITFAVSPVGETSQINQTLTKARVRIFYTGLNRNYTFITEEFAEKLLRTLPYTPVGGYLDEDGDFTDHGKSRDRMTVFGVVPENPNVTWEENLDKDGILRHYACCDAFLWTERYEKAKEIPGSAHSMELYLKSVKGDWKRDGALEYFEFTDGCFFGLTALGERVEPCFEGAAFYNLDDANKLLAELKTYNFSATNELIGGTKSMDNEKVLDGSVEEGKEGLEQETSVENNEQEPIVNNTEESIEPVEGPVEGPEGEGEDAGEPAEDPEDPAEPEEDPEEPEEGNEPRQQDEEEVETVSREEYELLQSKVTELENEISTYKAQVEELTSYKTEIEKNEKLAVIEKYSQTLSEEIVNNFTENIDNYTLETLKSAIAIEVVTVNEELLFNNSNEENVVVTDVEDHQYTSGAAKLMAKHKKN